MHKNHFSCYSANRICIVHSHFAVFKYLNFDFLRPWKWLEKGIVSHTGVHSGVSPLDTPLWSSVEIRHHDHRKFYALSDSLFSSDPCPQYKMTKIHYSDPVMSENTVDHSDLFPPEIRHYDIRAEIRLSNPHKYADGGDTPHAKSIFQKTHQHTGLGKCRFMIKP